MLIVVDGALCRTEPTKSDPTQPANVQKNLSQPDPLKLIKICIQYECKIFTICIDLHNMYSTYHKVMIRFAKTSKKCDPIQRVRGSIDLPMDNSDIWVLLMFVWSIEFHSNPSRDRPFPSPNQTDDLKKAWRTPVDTRDIWHAYGYMYIRCTQYYLPCVHNCPSETFI